jgi:hypothetical protein
MATIRQREIRSYRLRLHRTVGLYLALKAWRGGVNCIALSRLEVRQFFAMDSTPKQRMGEIQNDLKPWFKGFKTYYREGDNTYVQWLFLSQGEDTSFLPAGSTLSSLSAVKSLIEGLGSSAPKTSLFSDVSGMLGVPSQKDMITELTLLTAGLNSPTAKKA